MEPELKKELYKTIFLTVLFLITTIFTIYVITSQGAVYLDTLSK